MGADKLGKERPEGEILSIHFWDTGEQVIDTAEKCSKRLKGFRFLFKEMEN